MSKDVIIACDFQNKEDTFKFLNQFKETLYVKVGMELFYKEGPSIIHQIQERGHQIFLDLKLHDIPTTVYRTMKNIGKLNVDMVTIHTTGGMEMMESAVLGLKEAAEKKTCCVGVTILTSISETVLRKELLISEHINETILHYAQNALTSGLDGVVCSPLESSFIHSHISKDLLTITPGIRLESNENNDQVRVSTPKIARLLGSDYIVVGRTITRSNNPIESYQLVKKQFLNEGE